MPFRGHPPKPPADRAPAPVPRGHGELTVRKVGQPLPGRLPIHVGQVVGGQGIHGLPAPAGEPAAEICEVTAVLFQAGSS